MNAAETKMWLKQWQAAGVALRSVRVEELSRLDETQNAVIAASFFTAEQPLNESAFGEETSGLVEQQAIFLRFHRR